VTHWIRRWINRDSLVTRSLRHRRAAAVLTLLVVFAVSGCTSSGAQHEEWSEGWSTPSFVGSTDRKAGPAAVVGLPDGSLFVTAVDSPGGPNIQGEVQLLRVSYGQVNAVATVRAGVDGALRDLRLAVSPPGERIYLSYVVTHGDSATLRLATGIVEEAGRSVRFGEPETVVRVDSVLRDPGLSVAPDGRVLVYWSDMEDGLHSVYASLRDAEGGTVFDRLRMTSPDQVQFRPAAAILPQGFFLVWVEKELDTHTLVARTFGPEGTPSAAPVELGDFPFTEKQAPAVAVANSNHVALVWTGAAIIRGAAGRLTARYALLDVGDSNLVVRPTSVSPGLGSVVSPHLALDPTEDDEILVTWADNRSERLTVYYSRVARDGSVLRQGRVAVSNAEQLSPTCHIDESGTAHVVYHELDPSGEYRLFVVNDEEPIGPPWYWRLGLDCERPLGDALFLLVNFVAAAAVLAVIRYVGILLGLPLVWALDRMHRRPRDVAVDENVAREVTVLLLLFAVPFALETVGGVLFYEPLVCSAGLAWLRFVLSAVGTIVFLANSRLRLSDWLARLLGGYLFLFWYTLLALWAAQANI